LLLALGASSFATTTVVRDISGSAGDWTYSYTLTNGESLPIWQWAVWFTSDAEADVLTAGTTGWATTNLNTQGFFPEEYTSAWGCHVYDS